MVLSPIDGERAAVGENYDEWFSGGRQGFKKLLLRTRKIEVQAVSSKKTGIAGFAFLAFELSGEADNGDDDIRFACGVDGFLRKIWRQPEKTRGGFPGMMKVLHSKGVSVAGLKMDERGHGALAVRGPVVDDFLSVKENAGAAVGVRAQAVVAVNGRNEFAGPAHGIVLRGNARSGRNVVPFEIDGGIHALHGRVAG